jgi:hypothetical protein
VGEALRLFGRNRCRAEARVVSVEQADTEHICTLEVRPTMAEPFTSWLRTRREIAEGAMTYVLYDEDNPRRCRIDESRLRAAGIRDGRAYFAAHWEDEPRRRVSKEDSRAMLERLDRLNALKAAGHIDDAAYEAERQRILGKPVIPA